MHGQQKEVYKNNETGVIYMSYKKLIPCIFIMNGKAVKWFQDEEVISDDVVKLANDYGTSGADELIILDLSDSSDEHKNTIKILNEMKRVLHIPFIVGGHIKHMQDVSDILNTGAKKVIINFTKENRMDLLMEASKTFGKEKIAVSLNDFDTLFKNRYELEEYSSELIFMHRLDLNSMMNITQIPSVIITDTMDESELFKILKCAGVLGLSGKYMNQSELNYNLFKASCEENGIKMTAFISMLDFSQFKLNSDGLLPVVVQHYKTKEVLMVAYMDEEAFDLTIKTGKMTYYSRSRQKLWIKGETSGHFQYVHSLTIDCDQDTLLALVDQVGAACHTGNPSCFFTPVAGNDIEINSPLDTLTSLSSNKIKQYLHIKEGSSSLKHDKEIDKFLKELGISMTDLIIHTKNNEQTDMKENIANVIYQVMNLVAAKKLDWKDIIQQLEHIEE